VKKGPQEITADNHGDYAVAKALAAASAGAGRSVPA
jgi:hypothetical protein